jgi:hypothetical protein
MFVVVTSSRRKTKEEEEEKKVAKSVASFSLKNLLSPFQVFRLHFILLLLMLLASEQKNKFELFY